MMQSATKLHREQSGSIATTHTRARSDESTKNALQGEKGERDANKLWQSVQHLLPNLAEQRVAYLLFHCGLTPNEIVRRCPDEFSDVQEVQRLRCAIMKKLVSTLQYPKSGA